MLSNLSKVFFYLQWLLHKNNGLFHAKAHVSNVWLERKGEALEQYGGSEVCIIR